MIKASGDLCKEKVFESVFRTHATIVRNFLIYKFGNSETVGDVVQEAFVALWKACNRVPIDKAKSFLFKAGQNQFLKLLDKDKVRSAYASIPFEVKEIEDPEFQLEHKELAEKLKLAIDKLPEGQREVFLLHRIDGMSYKEIAEALEVSLKAVEKRMHKALVKLREICNNL